MRELFENNINWDAILGHSRDECTFTVEDAVFSQENNCLTITVRLNFIVPYLDSEKIKSLIISSLDMDVNVRINYIYEDLILSEEETIRMSVPYLTALAGEKHLSLAKNVDKDNYRADEEGITFATVGHFMADKLNQNLSREFEGILKSRFGITRKVRFENEETSYQKSRESWLNSYQRDIENSLRAQMEQHAEEAKAEGAPSAEPKPQKTFDDSKKRFAMQRKKKEAPAQGNIIMGGEPVPGPFVPYNRITEDSGEVSVEGILFSKESRPTKNGSILATFYITDKANSVILKTFVSKNKYEEIDSLIGLGDFIKVRGEAQYDKYDRCITIMVNNIEKGKLKKREDNYEGTKRVELHAHTKMSQQDGLNEVSTLVGTAARWGQTAVAVTDHGVVQSFPDAAKVAKKLTDKGQPIKIIYGMEGYVFDDTDCHNEDGTIEYKKPRTYHIILLAATQEGLKNIYKLVSDAHLNYFYRKPRLPKSHIAAHRDGIIIGSACEAGEVFQSVVNDLPEEEQERIASFYDYLEIQPLINNSFMIEKGIAKDEEELRNYNRKVLALGKKLGKPVVATTDAHYDEPESAIYRNIIMAGMGFKDAENGKGLYMRTTEEMLDEFSYLGEEDCYDVVIKNTNIIADRISPDILPVPKGKFPPKIDGAEETLRNSCMEKAYSIYGNPLPERIRDRLETELNSIISNGYAVMYVSAQMLVKKSLEDGYLVGSRGSVGSSFAATMAGITEVNPLEPHYICPNCKHLEWGDMELYDCGIDMPEKACPECGTMMKRDGFTIPFATFLGFNGDKEPDIDLNFAGEYQATAHKYVGTIFGEKNVFKAGTVGTIADKTAKGYVAKFYQEQNRPLQKAELERLAEGCTGVKRTTGQHPGGIIIVPDDHEIYEFCPVQHPANDAKSGIVTTHFDYHKIDENLLKLDILGHNVPSMIRQLQDMTGIDPLNVDLTDRKALSIFNGIEALDIKDPDYKYTHGTYAIPEFGTAFVRQMLDDTKPDKFADLVRISGFSHGTDVWLNNAQDYIRSGVATMREVISTRDDIMNYLILKGIENKTSFQIMEDVRKNRPLKDEQLKVMKDHGVPDWYIDSCIKIQYMFPRAHAVAYVMMSFRMAWYKVYYPAEFYATYFSSVVGDFDSETILKGGQACLDAIEYVNNMGENATQKDKDRILVYEVAYEMYSRGYEFEKPKLGHSRAMKFWVEDGKVLLPYVALEGVGESAAKAFVDAYEERPFETVEEATQRSKLNKTAVEALRGVGVFDGLPETDQLSFFNLATWNT